MATCGAFSNCSSNNALIPSMNIRLLTTIASVFSLSVLGGLKGVLGWIEGWIEGCVGEVVT